MKTNTQFILTLMGILIATISLTAQTKPIHKTKMEALAKLSGTLAGSGWMTTPDRQRVEFSQKEEITFELNGSVLHIRGEGFSPEGKQIHNALGVMFYDSTKGKYYMDAFLETGQHTVAELALTETGLNWFFETEQGGLVKYVITIQDGVWTEKGYYSPDGIAQYPFIEFTLTKNK